MMMVRMQHGHLNWMNRRAAGAGWRLLESVECTLSSTLFCDSSNKHLKNDELSKFITKDRIITQNMQGDTTTLGDSWKSVWGGKDVCVRMCIYIDMMCVDKCMCIYNVCMYVHISNIEHRMAARAEGPYCSSPMPRFPGGGTGKGRNSTERTERTCFLLSAPGF